MAVMTDGFESEILPEDLKKLLCSLASKWGDVIVDSNALQVVHLSGAMTNVIYRVTWPTAMDNVPRTVLVRVYGEGIERFFDRFEEIRVFECLSKLGYGPKLLGHFQGGRVEEFIHARTLSVADLRDAEISALIGARMREFHNLDMPGSKSVVLWSRMRKWLAEAKSLCSPELAKEHHLDRLEKELWSLEKGVSRSYQEVGFCHNDLQYGNIMIDDKYPSVTIIDYEYASYNPVAYDIANHFCEMAADYHTDTPHILNYSKYPDSKERQRFIENYLRSAGQELSNAVIEQLMEDVEKYTLASHIFWGLWGIISAHVNSIHFDYMGYARQRLEQYWLRKPGILNPKQNPAKGFGY